MPGNGCSLLEASVPLFVAYYRRCLPAFEKIKDLVGERSNRRVRFVSLRLYQSPRPETTTRQLPWRVQPEMAGGGYFYDLGSHQLDYLDFLFGPIISVASQVANQAGLYPAEDMLAAAWTHQSGVLGSGVWCFTVQPEQRADQAEICGQPRANPFLIF